MRILITQRALENYSGTELYTAEISRALAELGHEVAIYTPRPGRIARLITPSGVPVCQDLEALPWRPEIIHGHHHLPTMAALSYFDDAPAVYCWHGARPWVEEPPKTSRIGRYIVTSEKLRPRLTAELGISEDRVSVVPNFVDTKRFSHQRTVQASPQKAVLFAQGGFYPDELRLLEGACATLGLTLDKVGYAFDNPRPRPEYFLPDYDIAFAIGRSALEAMAAGCAAIPIVPQLAGTRVTARNFDDWCVSNFSPRYYRSAERFDLAWLRAELEAWNAEDIQQVTQKVRSEFTLDRAIATLTEIYREVAKTDAEESDGFTAYLSKIAKDADDLWAENRSLTEDLETARSELAHAHQQAKEDAARNRHLMMQLIAARGGVTETSELENGQDLRQAIVNSGAFDAEWYCQTFKEVAESGHDPLDHYLRHGAFEGRDPSASFDSAAYMEAHPHLRGFGISPLEHFVRQMALAAEVLPYRNRGS